MHSLDPVRLGLSAGLLSGISLFVLTLFSMSTGYAEDYLELVSGLYPGFDISFTGAVLGMLYGFVHAFLSVFIVAWVYNLLGSKID